MDVADHTRNPPSDGGLLPEPDFADEHSQQVLAATARTFARELGRQTYYELRKSFGDSTAFPPAGTQADSFPAGGKTDTR